MTAVLAAAVGRGYRGEHRLAQAVLGAGAPTTVHVAVRAEMPAQAPAADVLPELVHQPQLVSAASAHLSLVPVRHSQDPLVDTVPHPVVRLFPERMAGARTVPQEVTAAAGAQPYRSRHSA